MAAVLLLALAVCEEALKTVYFHHKPRTITQDRHKPHSPRRLCTWDDRRSTPVSAANLVSQASGGPRVPPHSALNRFVSLR